MAPKDGGSMSKSRFRRVLEKNLLLLTTLAGVIIGIILGVYSV